PPARNASRIRRECCRPLARSAQAAPRAAARAAKHHGPRLAESVRATGCRQRRAEPPWVAPCPASAYGRSTAIKGVADGTGVADGAGLDVADGRGVSVTTAIAVAVAADWLTQSRASLRVGARWAASAHRRSARGMLS